MAAHILTVFNAVDVPMDIQFQVMNLLLPFDADIYNRECDETGKAI